MMKSRWIKTIVAGMLLGSVNAYAQNWVLYDDFNNGVLNLNKWEIEGMTSNGPLEGEIAVVNNKLRFTHYPPVMDTGAGGQIIGLVMKQYRASIKGVQADIKVHNCDGIQQGRVQTVFGFSDQPQPDQYDVWAVQASVRPDQDTIAGLSFVDRWAGNGDYIDDVSLEFWGGFYDLGQIVDKTKRVSVRVNKDNNRSMYWYVAGEGQSVKHLPRPLNTTLPFKLRRHSISTRRQDVDGLSSENCIVEFDNVMVYR